MELNDNRFINKWNDPFFSNPFIRGKGDRARFNFHRWFLQGGVRLRRAWTFMTFSRENGDKLSKIEFWVCD
jgi:hypothetical protein